MRYLVNGQVTVGPAKFWRIDDTEAMSAPGYDPITFLMQPFALVNLKYVPDRDAIDALVKSMNAEVKA